MNKVLLAGFLGLFLWGSAKADQPALIYPSEAVLRSGVPMVGSLGAAGVFVSGKDVSSISTTAFVVSSGAPLRTATLSRMDYDLNVALLKIGAPVASSELQEINKQKLLILDSFLPPSLNSARASLPEEFGVSFSSGQPFEFKINGVLVGAAPVVLKKRKKEASFELTVIRSSTVPVWNVELSLTSEPTLSFWKKEKAKTLTDVPRPKFQFNHQVMFKPMSQGKIFKIPIEVYFIKDDSYVWTLNLKTKQDSMEQKISVTFNKK
jgi:hypothetical protein